LISGIFQTIPSLLVSTLFVIKRFFSFFDFPGATGLEKGQGLGARLGNFETKKWDEVGHQEVNGLKMRPGGTVSLPGRATSTRLWPVPPMPYVFTWFSLSWPKTIYLKGPLGVHERRQRRNTKTQNRGYRKSLEEDRRGNRCRSRLRTPLLLHQHLLLALHHEGGVIHPWTMVLRW
jgi:hypothetical protein